MGEYENPAARLRREDEDRQRRLAVLGAAYDDLLVTADAYTKAHTAARDGGWGARQLKDAGFVDPVSVRVPKAPAELLGARDRPREGAGEGVWSES